MRTTCRGVGHEWITVETMEGSTLEVRASQIVAIEWREGNDGRNVHGDRVTDLTLASGEVRRVLGSESEIRRLVRGGGQ